MFQTAPVVLPQNQLRRQPQSQLKQRRKQKTSRKSGCRNIESYFNVSNAGNRNVAAASSPAFILQTPKSPCSDNEHNQNATRDQQVQRTASGNGQHSMRIENDASASSYYQQSNNMHCQQESGQRSSIVQDKHSIRNESNASSKNPQLFPNAPFNTAKSGLAQSSNVYAVFSFESNQMPTTSARSMNAKSTSPSGLGQKCKSNTFPATQGPPRHEDRNKFPDFFSFLENDVQGQSACDLMNGDNIQSPFNTSDMNFVGPQDLALSLKDNKLTPWMEVSFNQIKYLNNIYKGLTLQQINVVIFCLSFQRV